MVSALAAVVAARSYSPSRRYASAPYVRNIALTLPFIVAGSNRCSAGAVWAAPSFRSELYACLTTRADALFELTDAMLCVDGPMKTLVSLALVPEHRRGHGALYTRLNHSRLDVGPIATGQV
ncbi:transposase [Streptomyces sp. SCA3-4]|nr:transposase [Streptomyces sichuanensis]